MDTRYAAHDLSEAALGGSVRIEGARFVDAYGRSVNLRGLNVSGASKLPTTPNGLSHLTDGFYEHRTVTFAGRPFPLDEAPLHFRRLRAWGLPLVRLLVTWESLGHAGPDPEADLDLEYIAYLRELVQLMPRYGIKCFICTHQDVWSRFSGGSGAPGWTFEAAGLDVRAFTDTGAAYIHGEDEERRAKGLVNEKEPGGPFLWPSGYQKLAASTMATLFWAGDALAPNLKCQRASETVSIQEYLQGAYIEAFGRLADEVANLEACIGFEPMNEPHRGLVNLHGFDGWNYETDLHIGHYPTFAQALALGSGYAQTVKFYVKSWPFPTRMSHRSLVDPKGRSAWLSGESAAGEENHGMGECVWRAHGVWKWDDKKQAAVVLQKNYFEVDHRPGREGQSLEWYKDCYTPFLQRFSARMAKKNARQMSFVEPIPNEFIPPWPESPSGADSKLLSQDYAVKTILPSPRPSHLVYAPHFYDLNVLFSKHHAWMSVNVQGLSRGMFFLQALYFGAKGLRNNYKKQLRNLVQYGQTSLGPVPTIIGEIGIPFDINERGALGNGQFDTHRDLMHALIAGMEDNQVGFTLWNYNPHNRVEYGDGWNKEDFSIINGDDPADGGSRAHEDYRNAKHEDNELYRGGRVLDVVIRPYAAKVAGTPLQSDWDPKTLRFEFSWESRAGDDHPKARQTEIFVPEYHYAAYNLNIQVDGAQWTHDKEKQTIFIHHEAHTGTRRHRIAIGIFGLQRRLLQQVLEKRERFPPSFPYSLLSPDAEARLAEDGMMETILFQVFAIVVILLASVLYSLR